MFLLHVYSNVLGLWARSRNKSKASHESRSLEHESSIIVDDGDFGAHHGVITNMQKEDIPAPALHVAKAESNKKKGRILIAFYGQKNRDRACSKQSHYRIIDDLKQAGFHVHSHLIAHGTEQEKVDDVPYIGYLDKCAYDTCELKDITMVKQDANELCKSRPCFSAKVKRKPQKDFITIQLLAEWSVGKYVQNHRSNYDLVIAVSDDIFLAENFPIDQIQEALMKKNTIYTSSALDWGGIQNGIYFGHPDAMAKMLCRAEAPVRYGGRTGVWRQKWNYEQQVLWAFVEYGIQREYIRPYSVVAFYKVRHNQNIARYPPYPHKPPPPEELPPHMMNYMYGSGGHPLNPGPDLPVDLQECFHNVTLRELEIFANAGPVQKSCLYMFAKPEGCSTKDHVEAS